MDSCRLCSRNVMDIYTQYCYYHGCHKHKCENMAIGENSSICQKCKLIEQEIKCRQFTDQIILFVIIPCILSIHFYVWLMDQ